MSRYVGIDVHRRRSVVVILDPDGTKVSSTRIENSPLALAAAVAEAGAEPEVVVEATWGWYWAAGVLEEAGCRVLLAHPLGVKGLENRRVKNDDRDGRREVRTRFGAREEGEPQPRNGRVLGSVDTRVSSRSVWTRWCDTWRCASRPS